MSETTRVEAVLTHMTSGLGSSKSESAKMPANPQTTAALLSDDKLRGRPKQILCFCCGGSRDDQIRITYYTEDCDPLCVQCWEKQYNNGEPDEC